MVRAASPATVTGGSGFGFEDQVGAYYLAHLLACRMPLGKEFGPIQSIQFQVRDAGWLLDDLLLVTAGDGRARSFSISIKSNRQVTRNGFPTDFVRSAWEQWLGIDKEVFQEERDIIGLVTGELASVVRTAWSALLRAAMETDPARLAQRIATPRLSSKVQRALFASLQCPSDLRARDKTDDLAAARLIRHLRLLHLDFTEEPSAHRDDAIDICRSLLDAESSHEAASLWDHLVGVVSDKRQCGGSIGLPEILRALRNEHRLKDYADYRADWRNLERRTAESMDDILDTVGGNVSLLRYEQLESIQGQLREIRAIVLLGNSGCGKSALAKRTAQRLGGFDKVVWLDGSSLNAPDLMSVERSLGLANSFEELLRSIPATRALLVLDGIDRFSEQALQRTVRILRLCDLDGPASPWHVLATSSPERWEVTATQLSADGGWPTKFDVLPIGDPLPEETVMLLEACPSLRPLALRTELQPLLSNLKTFDWVAVASMQHLDAGPSSWVGMSDVVDWVWARWIGQGGDRHARAGLLKKLGETEASSLENGVPTSCLTGPELTTLGALANSGLLVVKDERARFAHDLLSDWARLRILMGQEATLAEELKTRVTSPRWHRAIRLYGQRLLEHCRTDTSSWQAVMRRLSAESNEDILARDLLLESVIFATNGRVLLEHLLPELLAENGLLLNRLLKRFLHVATYPDPRIPEVAETEDTKHYFASEFRVPLLPYWPPMLAFLHRHKGEVIPISWHLTARVCGLWLSALPSDMGPGRPFPWRRQAAVVTVAAAREVQGLKAAGVHILDDLDQAVYEAALAAVPDLPEEVSSLALELARRCDESPEIQTRAHAYKVRVAKNALDRQQQNAVLASLSGVPSLGRARRGPRKEPWPDGPRERVDDGFQEACLKGPAMIPLIRALPETALEVLLAVCIEPPAYEGWDGSDWLLDHIGTTHSRDLYPPMYFRGPFLPFLQLQPVHGLEFILRLVNFATERWQYSEEQHANRFGAPSVKPAPVVSVPLDDGPVQWVGDHRPYGWYRHLWIHADCVTSALMALEKWFYDELDAGHDVSRWIELILRRSRSNAFAGVLSALGKREPKLFEGPLRPLLGIWRIYDWDYQLVMNGDVWRIEMMSWVRGGETVYNGVRDWHMFAHRKGSLRDLAVLLMLSNAELAKWFESIRANWTSELAGDPDNESLELLLARFDPANYQRSRLDDGRYQIGLVWPEHLRERIEAAASDDEDALALMGFPLRCHRIIEERNALTDADLPNFWNELQRFAVPVDESEREESSRSRADALCAGIAVLLLLHREWLRSDSAREQWCLEQLEGIWSRPPQRDEFAVPNSVMPTAWDRAFAKCAVVLLSEAPDDELRRRWVAASVTAYHYEATSTAMHMARDLRRHLGDDFMRLTNLVVLWAGLRGTVHRAQSLGFGLSRWNRWYGAMIAAFVARLLPTQPLSWQRIGAAAERLGVRMTRRKYPGFGMADPAESEDSVRNRRSRRKRSHPGFDPRTIQAGFGWLVDIDIARGASERNSWIGLVHEVLGVTLRMLPSTEEDQEVDGTPYELDHWVFELVAKVIPKLTPEENAESLWRPILELGPAAHYWVEGFLSDWFIHGERASPAPELFVSHWHAMIRHALQSPTWTPGSWLSRRHLEDMFIQLMGLGWAAEAVREAKYAAEIESMLPAYKAWAHRWLQHSRSAASFAAFLARPAGRKLISPGIRWLHSAVAGYDDRDWRWDNLEGNLVEALHACWSQQGHLLGNNRDLKDAFFGLLGLLTRRQTPSAMELRDRVLRSIQT